MYVPSHLFLSVLSRKQILQHWVKVYVDFKLCCRPKKWEIMKKVRKKAIRGRLCSMQFSWESRCWEFLCLLYIYIKIEYINISLYYFIYNYKWESIPDTMQTAIVWWRNSYFSVRFYFCVARLQSLSQSSSVKFQHFIPLAVVCVLKILTFELKWKAIAFCFRARKSWSNSVILFFTFSKKCRIFAASCFRRIWTRTSCCFEKPKRWTSLLKKTYWTSFSLYFAPKVNRVQVYKLFRIVGFLKCLHTV